MGNHLGVILKDCKIFSLIVLLCKSWYLSNHTLAKQIVLLQNIISECVPDDELDAFMCAELHLFMANIHCNNENFEACYHELIRFGFAANECQCNEIFVRNVSPFTP